uniref:Mitogen activated protein kinase kinase kinase n=1 Tax=Echinococcus granulosus TaxID=6210 RepID=A0A068WI13_ECHGR|nr:mitogen activated protein kinase kinase kinase [Echinococcus granulosus]
MNSDQLCVVCIVDGNLSARKDAVSIGGKGSAISAVIQACEAIKARVQHYTFDQISKNNTEVLDALYNAEILVIDISGWKEISVVLYHLGVRESVKSTVNLVLVCADDVDLPFEEPNLLLPYVKDEEGCARYVDSGRLNLLNGEVANVKGKIMGALPLLSSRLKECFMDAQNETRLHLSCQFVKELRVDRETLKDDELREKLHKMRRRLDDPRLLSPDSLLNMFLSYMHVEAYSEMISLMEAIQGLENYQHLLEPPNIRYYYAFALNRRNGKGDREKALSIIKDVIENCKQPFPDLYGLEGRIYKDRFVESNCTDRESLEKATESYRKGFQESSSEYLGINLATLLVIGGADRSNKELATVCNMLYINAGRKGNLQDLQDYWDVATFFEVSVLWADYAGAVKAAKYMHKLNPPSWHLGSTLRNIRLILRARRIRADTTDKDMELFNFWLEFFHECIQNPETKKKLSEGLKGDEEGDNEKKNQAVKSEETSAAEAPLRIYFPVLLVDMSGEELRPAHLHIHAHSDKPNMRVCYIESGQQPPPKTSTHRAVTPMVFTFAEENGTENGESAPLSNLRLNPIYDLVFYEDDIKGFSLNPKDKRNLYFFTVQAEDYSIFFPCERSRTEFLAAIRASLSESDNYLFDEHEDDEPIKFVYEFDESGHPIVLGSGSFGTVYAGRELSREVKIAIKEIKNIPQKDLQPLIEEINLQSRLNHTNIVCYLGSVYEDGVLKILMEHVPGGSLSFLLKKIGSLRDETVSHYSSQILEGLRYLHASKIVHRDIKGDNILVNMYRGELKIADFGASKRLGGLIRKAGTVTGTMRFMAPELINASKDGYGYPADIWSFGCTVVEMVTGKLPYHELDAFAAFYRAGYYSAHPDIPEELPEPCKAFIKRCFEIDPEKRASADELLTDPFILMYKRHKGRPQAKRGTSPRPPDSVAPLNLTGTGQMQKLLSENQSERRKVTPFSASPYRTHLSKVSNTLFSHTRTLSSATSQTAPILQGSQQELSPLKTLDLPTHVNTTTAMGRRPEQCHSRERASYGGTPGGAELFGPTEEALRSPPSATTYNSDMLTTSKISLPSPFSGSIQSPENFNVIKSMDEAKKQLSSALMQSKTSVVNWWVEQTIGSARLPKPAGSLSRNPSSDMDGASTTSPKISSEMIPSSREHNEHDLIECMFDFLIDTLDGGDSLQSLNRLLKSTIRNATVTPNPKSCHAPTLGSLPRRISTSFSFDKVQPVCEFTFVAVISRILQQQRLTIQPGVSEMTFPENVIQQLVAFIERAWYVVTRRLPEPLRDGGQCQKKPHEMLTWITLINDIAGKAIDQLPLQEQSTVLRRTKTISAGQRMHLEPSRHAPLRVRSFVPPQAPTTFFATEGTVASPWLRPTRHVQIVSPSALPDSGQASVLQESSTPASLISPADSQLTGADSDEVSYTTNRRASDQTSPARGLIGRRTQLRRNAYPLRYVKRAIMPLSGTSSSNLERRHQHSHDTSELSDLKYINAQITEELKEVTRNYNQLLQSELERREAYIAALERLAKSSLSLTDALALPALGVYGGAHTYAGISTGFPSLVEWLTELEIPISDIEQITNHQIDQDDFLEGGSVLRIWGAVCKLRRKFLSSQRNKETNESPQSEFL